MVSEALNSTVSLIGAVVILVYLAGSHGAQAAAFGRPTRASTGLLVGGKNLTSQIYMAMVPSREVILPYNTRIRVTPQELNNGGFWGLASTGKWEPHTYNILEKHITAETYVVDFGSWIGPTALFAATRAKYVLSLEPDPAAYAVLRMNFALSSSLLSAVYHVRQCAVCTMPGPVQFLWRGGNSASGLEQLQAVRNWGAHHVQATMQMPCFTLQQMLLRHEIPKGAPLFIKMDVEGHEVKLLPTLHALVQEYKPTMYVALHNDVRPFSEEETKGVLEFLRLFPNVVHGETMQPFNRITPASSEFRSEVLCTWGP